MGKLTDQVRETCFKYDVSSYITEMFTLLAQAIDGDTPKKTETKASEKAPTAAPTGQRANPVPPRAPLSGFGGSTAKKEDK